MRGVVVGFSVGCVIQFYMEHSTITVGSKTIIRVYVILYTLRSGNDIMKIYRLPSCLETAYTESYTGVAAV